MVLRDSGSPRCDCLASVEKAKLGVVDRICIPHPCRNGSDPEAVCRRTHKARTLLVVESMKCTEGQIIANVIMFIPIGILAGWLWKWKGLWVAAGLSVFIEVLQLTTARGLCEFDDVFHNMIGAVIGVGIVMIGRKLLGESE